MNRQINKPVLVAVVLFLFASLVIASQLIKRRQELRRGAAGENSSLSLPSNKTVDVGEEFDLPVMVNTDSKSIIAVDVVINFDKNYLELVDVTPNPQTGSLETFMPLDSSGNFKSTDVVNQANSTGQIKFGSAAYRWNSEEVLNGFNGVLGLTNPLAVLKFKAVKEISSTGLNFQFTPGGTTDSNLVAEGEDILAGVSNSEIKIKTITPTDTVTKTPTRTDTPIPTNTTKPTGTLIPTDTPMPTDAPRPTDTQAPTSTSRPTNTPWPTNTPTLTNTPTNIPTNTPRPTETNTPMPTDTSWPTDTQAPTSTTAPGQPTSTPRPTNTPWPTNTPLPTNTSQPTHTPTKTPTNTPTLAPDQAEVEFNIKLAGTDYYVGGQRILVDVPEVLVDVIVKNDEYYYRQEDVLVQFNDQAVGKGSVKLDNFKEDNNYSMLIKGPVHLMNRYCKNEQKGYCWKNEAGLEISTGVNKFNFADWPLVPGDINQDGVVDVVDFSVLKQALGARNYPREDINFNGIVNSQDINFLLQTLSTRYEDEI